MLKFLGKESAVGASAPQTQHRGQMTPERCPELDEFSQYEHFFTLIPTEIPFSSPLSGFLMFGKISVRFPRSLKLKTFFVFPSLLTISFVRAAAAFQERLNQKILTASLEKFLTNQGKYVAGLRFPTGNLLRWTTTVFGWPGASEEFIRIKKSRSTPEEIQTSCQAVEIFFFFLNIPFFSLCFLRQGVKASAERLAKTLRQHLESLPVLRLWLF